MTAGVNSLIRFCSIQASNMKLKLPKEPVAKIANAIFPPEPLGSLTWCYASETFDQ
jgi:hypothetical protein